MFKVVLNNVILSTPIVCIVLVIINIKIPDIDRAKMDPRSITSVITDIKDEEFYELATKLGKLKARCT